MATSKRAKRLRHRMPPAEASNVTVDGAAFSITHDRCMTRAHYDRMTEVMKQLAMRDVKHEAAVMRIANAGGIAPVVEYVKMMRVYQKKHKK